MTDKASHEKWLVVFQDMGCYISPNWYPDKAKNHKVVPTWNYRAVHCQVTPTFTTEVNNLKHIVSKLSDIHEANEPIPWSLDDAPAHYINTMCKAIIGFKLKIVDIQAQFKLSQNKDAVTQASIMSHLAKSENASNQDMAKTIAKKTIAKFGTATKL